MAFVADASVTAAWFLRGQANAYTDRLLERLSAERVYVPCIWPAEFANIVLVLERRRKLSKTLASDIFRLAERFPIVVDHEEVALSRLYRLGVQYALTAYDAAYLELALRLALPLCARDGALVRAAPAAGLQIE